MQFLGISFQDLRNDHIRGGSSFHTACALVSNELCYILREYLYMFYILVYNVNHLKESLRKLYTIKEYDYLQTKL